MVAAHGGSPAYSTPLDPNVPVVLTPNRLTSSQALSLSAPPAMSSAPEAFWTESSADLTLKTGTLTLQDLGQEILGQEILSQADVLVAPDSTPATFAQVMDPVAVLKVGERYGDGTVDLPVATLYSYTIDGQAAATVYVRDLPIISFVDQDPELASPLERATDLTSQLNQLAQWPLESAEITVDLLEPDPADGTAHYLIKIDQDPLVAVDQGVLLTHDKNNHAIAALMAANRLRRLLFDAPPLSSVPQPVVTEPDPIAADSAQDLPEPTLQAQTQDPDLADHDVVAVEQGIASFYHHPAAAHPLTAAHRTLPFGTRVRVTNIENGAQAVVEINDRGPFIPGRVIDVSIAAAQALRMIQMGIAPVRVEVLD